MSHVFISAYDFLFPEVHFQLQPPIDSRWDAFHFLLKSSLSPDVTLRASEHLSEATDAREAVRQLPSELSSTEMPNHICYVQASHPPSGTELASNKASPMISVFQQAESNRNILLKDLLGTS